MLKTLRAAAAGLALAAAFSGGVLAQPIGGNLLAVPADAPPVHVTAPGPYAVTVFTNPTLATHTIYQPDLTAVQGKMPIVAWGNGACVNVGRLFENFLTEIASHGFLVIAIGPENAPLPAFARRPGGPTPAAPGAAPAAPAASPAPAAGAPAIPPAATRGSQLIDAINWAIAENDRAGSPYYQRLDVTKIAVMGQSCGGLQAIEVSGDPRITTTVIWNSGVFNTTAGMPTLSNATKASLAAIHGPIAYFLGGPTDVAYPNGEDDYTRINQVPIFKGNLGVGHGGTYSQPGGGWFGEVGVAWLKWQLKGDAVAGRMFTGADCGLCTNPVWKVEKKGL